LAGEEGELRRKIWEDPSQIDPKNVLPQTTPLLSLLKKDKNISFVF